VDRLDAIRDFNDNRIADRSYGEKPDFRDSMKFLFREYDRATDIERIKAALGHNMGDVVNVFPFQAGCVPFLLPAFNGAMDFLKDAGLPEAGQKAAAFFLIMAFSTVADNYVGCKVGLELFPDSPQIALVAAIQGGSMSAIGNMANVAQFNLNDFPLAKSFAMAKWHLDNVAVGAAWAAALEAFKFVAPPAEQLGLFNGQRDDEGRMAANDDEAGARKTYRRLGGVRDWMDKQYEKNGVKVS